MSISKFPAIRRRKQGYLSLKHSLGGYEISLFGNNDDTHVSVTIKAYGHSFVRVIRKQEKFARCVAFDKLRCMIITAAHTMIMVGEDSQVIELGYKALVRNILRAQRQLQKARCKQDSGDPEMREWAELVIPKLQDKLDQKLHMLDEFNKHPRVTLLNFKDIESANS